MALSEFSLNEEPIGSDEVGAFAGTIDYWAVINGVLEHSVRMDTINIEDTQGGASTATFELINPTSFPRAGQSVALVWQDQTLFGGQLVTVDLNMEPDESVFIFSCQASGWMRILERRTISAEYTNQTFLQIANDVFSTTLVNEGITKGVFDSGPSLLLANADNIRVSEFLRDVAEASGGIVYIDPYKVLQFRTSNIDVAPFLLTEADVEFVESEEDLDQYRNWQHVKVTGTSGASQTVERFNSDEIAARIALEGGTGIYEDYKTISHPTSNDTVQLQRLGISYALVRLAATARVRRIFRARIRRPELRLGQILTVNLQAYQLAGVWQITRLRTWDEGGFLRFQFEAQLTNFQQLALDSLLRIVDAGRATVMLPIAQFANLDTITTLGASTYTIVGVGTVEVEITVYGAGGGGQAASTASPFFSSSTAVSGAPGSPGGKAISFRSYPAGTILNIVVGTGGTGGIFAGSGFQIGTAGTPSRIEVSGALVAHGAGGGGGGDTVGAGTGEGDLTFTGDGRTGGAGGTPPGGSGATGDDGKVEIRY